MLEISEQMKIIFSLIMLLTFAMWVTSSVFWMQSTILVFKIKKLFNEIDEKMREAKKCEIEKFDVRNFEGHLKTLKNPV